MAKRMTKKEKQRKRRIEIAFVVILLIFGACDKIVNWVKKV